MVGHSVVFVGSKVDEGFSLHHRCCCSGSVDEQVTYALFWMQNCVFIMFMSLMMTLFCSYLAERLH